MTLHRYAVAAVLVLSLHAAEFATRTDWPSYGGIHASLRYSALDQIHTRNVARLVPAWVRSFAPAEITIAEGARWRHSAATDEGLAAQRQLT
jgi:glucose dehydrogenase